MNNDLKTTILGGGGALAVLATVDVDKLGDLNRAELAKVALAVLLWAWGYFTNKSHAA